MTSANISPTKSFETAAAKLALAGASSLIALAIATPAMAAEAQGAAMPVLAAAAADAPQSADETPSDQAIIVTGLRGSLQRNLDIKRTSPGVVDAISSEDIGKFPDSNVAASLQRLPGVSIQRAGARGEPTGITVRGFGGDFNETLYDGRRISTATGGRSVDFSTVGADFVGGLAVLKTPDVSLSSASIGATVNVMFPKPLDRPGLHFAATASGSIQDAAGKVVPTVGGLFSDTFADDTIGVLVDAVYTRRDTQSNRVYVAGWPGGYYAPCQLAGSTAATCNPSSDASATPSNRKTVLGWFPQQYGATQIYTKDERLDGRIALQWQASDSLLISLDDNYSRQKVRGDNFGFGIWFNQDALRNVSLDGNGTATNFMQAGSQTDFVAGIDKSRLETNQVGLNLKWDVSDNFHLELDGSYAKSTGDITADNGDIGYGFGIGANLGVRLTGDSKDHFPELNAYGVNGDQSRWADTSVIGSHVLVRTAQKNEDTVKQVRFGGTWEKDDFSLKFGARYLEDNFQLQNSNTFVNNFWQAYSGYGTPSGSSTGVLLPSSLYEAKVSTNGFIPGFTGTLPPVLLKYSPLALYSYLASLGNPQAKNIPGFNYAASNVGTKFTGSVDLALDPGSVQNITEKSWSFYVRTNYVTDIAGMKFHFNAGLREEITDISSAGIGQVATQILPSPGDPTLLTVTLSGQQPVVTKSSYAYLLPSLDMKLELTDRLHLRFDASRTLTRPALNLLTPVLNVGTGQRVGALTANGGNPALKPYLADNFDLAAEWYYAPNSYASVDFFIKDVSNFIVQGTQRQAINGLIDPSTGQLAQFSVSSRFNGPNATIRGVEIALQHVFGNSGFGFNANATFVNTNKPYNRNDISSSGFAVTGLANSANFVGFYDKNGFQARVAANYRGEYLLQFGQNQNTGAFGSEPTFVNSSLQVDFSTSYEVTKQLTVFFEALNLTNEVVSTHGRYDNQLLDVFAYGRRFTGGARFRF